MNLFVAAAGAVSAGRPPAGRQRAARARPSQGVLSFPFAYRSMGFVLATVRCVRGRGSPQVLQLHSSAAT